MYEELEETIDWMLGIAEHSDLPMSIKEGRQANNRNVHVQFIRVLVSPMVRVQYTMYCMLICNYTKLNITIVKPTIIKIETIYIFNLFRIISTQSALSLVRVYLP